MTLLPLGRSADFTGHFHIRLGRSRRGETLLGLGEGHLDESRVVGGVGIRRRLEGGGEA
jgi:hypothetical protein